MFRRLHGPRPAGRAGDPRRRGRSAPGDRARYALGELPGLRAAQERARPQPDPGRLHRRRGDRAGDLRLLPGARHQPQAALRPDRGERLHHPAARRRGAGRHRRRAVARGRAPDRRERRGLLPLARASSWSTSRTPRAPPRPRTPTAGWRPATPASSSARPGTCGSSTGRRTWAAWPTGSLFAPKYVENKLKFYPNILEAVVVRRRPDMACAFVNIDLTAVGNWAERNNIAYASYQELAAQPRGLRDDPGPRGGGEPQPRRRPDARRAARSTAS